MSANEAHNEILKEFQSESKELISQLLEILEGCEGDFSQVKRLEQYGQIVDRIMGAAKSLEVMLGGSNSFVAKIGDYSALCKAVGYKASQIKDNAQFYDVCVAFLFDATEMLMEMIEGNFDEKLPMKELFSSTFRDRLKWVSDQFGAEYRASVAVGTPTKAGRDEIDLLLEKLGLS
jgi:hypothetical protein